MYAYTPINTVFVSDSRLKIINLGFFFCLNVRRDDAIKLLYRFTFDNVSATV